MSLFISGSWQTKRVLKKAQGFCSTSVYSQTPHRCVAHLTFICVMPSKVQWKLIQSIIKLYHCQQLTESQRIQDGVHNKSPYSMTELYLPTQKFRGVTTGLNATPLTVALLKKWLHARERSWWNSPSLFCSKDLHSERIPIWANKTWSTYLSVILTIHHFTHLINIRMKKPECWFSDLGNGKGVSAENQIDRV